MLGPLARSLPEVLGHQSGEGITVLQEPSIGSVIPDLLLGFWRRRRPDLVRERFTVVENHVLALLEREGPLSVAEIKRCLYLTDGGARRALARLTKAGAIGQEREGKVVCLRDEARTAHVEIVAVEAKMRRWREALRQAISYQEFSDRAFVALDGNQVRFSETIEQAFTAAGVGLILLHQTMVRVVLPAENRWAITPDRVRAANKLSMAYA